MEASVTSGSAQARAAYDAESLADLEDLFGRPRLLTLLAGLRNEIDARLPATADDRKAIGLDAHALVSSSGALGFTPLSLACVELERACLASADVSAQLAAVRAAATEAKLAIDELCGRAV